MKKFMVVLLVLAIVIAVLVLAKDAILTASVKKGVAVVTGLSLDMDRLHVSITKPVADIRGLKLFNPEGFPDTIMADMPEIFVRYNLPAILRGTIHLPEVRLALKEFVVVKNAKGELNLNALQPVQSQQAAKTPPQKTEGKAPDIKIDVLILSIGKVIYKDYSRSATPAVREFNVNLNERYTNITDPNTLTNMIVAKALMNTTIASLANFDLKGLQGSVKEALSGAQKISADAAAAAQETVKQGADTVKGLLTNPFGADKK